MSYWLVGIYFVIGTTRDAMFKRINMKSRGSIQRSDVACLLFGNAEFCTKMMSQILENVFRLRHSGQ